MHECLLGRGQDFLAAEILIWKKHRNLHKYFVLSPLAGRGKVIYAALIMNKRMYTISAQGPKLLANASNHPPQMWKGRKESKHSSLDALTTPLLNDHPE